MNKKHNLAIAYAEKALAMNQKNGLAYSTLAETYGMLGNDEQFYKNAEAALQCGFPLWEHLEDLPYQMYTSQSRFKQLLSNYRKN